MRGTRRRAMALLTALVLLGPGHGHAEDSEKKTVLGVEVEPYAGRFVVARDVNLRSKSSRYSKKVRSLKRGEMLEAVGKAAKGWLAVSQNGAVIGFVVQEMLLPLIDGRLEADLTGKAQGVGGRKCEYVIHFEGKSPVEGDLFETSDYDVRLKCGENAFNAFMFITEAPYALGAKRNYQINMDVMEIGGDYEEVLSTAMEYRLDSERLFHDENLLKELGRKPDSPERPAANVPDALKGAVEMAVESWNDKAWKRIEEAIAKP